MLNGVGTVQVAEKVRSNVDVPPGASVLPLVWSLLRVNPVVQQPASCRVLDVPVPLLVTVNVRVTLLEPTSPKS